jgi:hypothetical protein
MGDGDAPSSELDNGVSFHQHFVIHRSRSTPQIIKISCFNAALRIRHLRRPAFGKLFAGCRIKDAPPMKRPRFTRTAGTLIIPMNARVR